MGGSQEGGSSGGSFSLLTAKAVEGGWGLQQQQQRQALAPAEAGGEVQSVEAFHIRPTFCSTHVGCVGNEPRLLSKYASLSKDSREEARRTWLVQVSEIYGRYHRDPYMVPTDLSYWEVAHAILCALYLLAGGQPCSYVLCSAAMSSGYSLSLIMSSSTRSLRPRSDGSAHVALKDDDWPTIWHEGECALHSALHHDLSIFLCWYLESLVAITNSSRCGVEEKMSPQYASCRLQSTMHWSCVHGKAPRQTIAVSGQRIAVSGGS